MRYLSVCSGIEAASVAWHPLGWHCVGVAEIDPFASAVLAHRYPDTPNFGNLEHYRDWPLKQGDIDLLVGGTPCQAFSVAGLRHGLADPRGNLALTYLGLVEHLQPRWVVWENVPGVLSSNGGRDFGTFLGGLAELGYGWAYRIMDAQYVRVESHPHAVPQRRRRVFVVGCSRGDWKRAARVLLEPEGVRGDPPTRRTTRETTADDAGASTARDDRARVAHRFNADMNEGHTPILEVPPAVVPIDLRNTARGDKDTNNRQNSSGGSPGTGIGNDDDPAFTLSARGQAVAVAFCSNMGGNDGGIYSDGSTGTLTTERKPAIAFTCKDYGGDASVEIAPTLRAMGHSDSHANGGGQLAIAFNSNTQACQLPTNTRDTSVSGSLTTNQNAAVALSTVFTLEVRGREGGRVLEYRADGTANALRTPNGGRDGLGVGAIAAPSLTASNDPATMAVRRLTPRECERLQGFPDDYTQIPYKGKPAADGPRYKALGNSMAVNVMRWVGERLRQFP